MSRVLKRILRLVETENAHSRRKERELRMAARLILEGKRPILDGSGWPHPDRPFAESLRCSMQAADSVFLDEILSNHEFGLVGTWIGRGHPLMRHERHRALWTDHRIPYRLLDRRQRVEMSSHRLEPMMAEAHELGLTTLARFGTSRGKQDPSRLLVWNPKRHSFAGRVKALAFSYAYEYDQETVIVNSPRGDIERFEWGWRSGDNRDSTVSRTHPKGAPLRMSVLGHNARERTSEHHFATTRRKLQMEPGWELLRDFLIDRNEVQRYLFWKGHRLLDCPGNYFRSFQISRMREMDTVPTWRIRPMGDGDALMTGLPDPFWGTPTLPLAYRLADETNWPVVLETEGRQAFLESIGYNQTGGKVDPYLGQTFGGEEIKDGTFIVEPPSWKSVVDFWEVREARNQGASPALSSTD